MLLWIGGDPVDSVAVTELVDYPGHREARVVFGAGHIERAAEGWPMVEDWARFEGASALEVIGRPGWERRLPPGFVKDAVVLRKVLT